MRYATASPCCSTSALWRVPWRSCCRTIIPGFRNISTGRGDGRRPGRSIAGRMDNKSPYVLIGAAMMLFIAAVVGFVIWQLRAGDQTSYAYYVILFSGDVQGLTVDSPVYYRALRVGRVREIQLAARQDVQRSTARARSRVKVEVTVAVASNVDIRERSNAVFETPYIAGASFTQT